MGANRPCAICSSPKLSEIVTRRNEIGPKWKAIAEEFEVSKDALFSHYSRGHGTAEYIAITAAEPEDKAPPEPELAGALRSERQKREAVERANRVLKDQLADLEKEQAELTMIRNFIYGRDGTRRIDIPEWLSPPRGEGHHGTVNLLLSDLHLDEVIKPDAIGRSNAFNRKIALQRVQRTFKKSIELPRDFMSGVVYDGIVVHLAGDTFSGNIHEELALTNEAYPFESILYWVGPFVAGIKLLADEYSKVHIVSVPGNHDRTSRKPVHKGRVETSLHFLFTKFLEQHFAGDERVTWNIPLGPDAYTTNYGFNMLTTHGDQFKGGNGIGGILIPILRGDSRKRQRQSSIGQPYDLLVMGHFHQYISGPGVLINGSLKGYDEYAYNNNFAFEVPQQALWVVTPEHGASFHMPIQCQDRKAERWV